MATQPDDTVAGTGAWRQGEGAPPSAPGEDELATGARAGDYVVVRRLAVGGHGSVYLAEHRGAGRRVALKVMHRAVAEQGGMVARFALEARLVGQLRHPNIVHVHDLGTLPDGRPWCAMELLEGRSLRELLAARGRLAPLEVLAIVEPVCAALGAAHAAGIVHRDVKASNVMVNEGPPLSVKLLDFGVAKALDAAAPGLTTAGQRLGTAGSMAPEQIRGEPVDARTDVYGAGVLLHQLLTGELPFAGRDAAELERQHLGAPPPRPSARAPVPALLDAVVLRCLAKRKEDRYGSAAELAAALREALLGDAGAGTWREAIAVHAAAEAAPGAGDDALLAAADAAAEAEAALRAAGLAVPLATGDAVLGLALLGDAPALQRARRAEVIALARGIEAAISARLAGGHAQLAVSVHAGRVRVRTGPAGDEIVGGPLCETGRWAAERAGLHVTSAAAAGLDPS